MSDFIRQRAEQIAMIVFPRDSRHFIALAHDIERLGLDSYQAGLDQMKRLEGLRGILTDAAYKVQP